MWEPGAERKLVTVLLVDVDELVDDFDEPDPEDAAAVLATRLDHVRAAVDRFGGSVLDVIGNRTLAVFGVPHCREDDPERAVRAALAIRDTLTSQEPRTRFHVAVATGGALIQPLGVQPITGEVVSTCARLLETMPAGTVLVTEAAARATERTISYDPGRVRSLPGRTQPVLTRTAQAPRNPPGLDDLAGDLPLVGRGSELRTLMENLERAHVSRRPQLVTLLGAPGIGKTRLVAELGRVITAGPKRITCRTGRSLAYSENMAFWALAEIVRAEAKILDSDTGEQITKKILRAAQRALPGDARAAAWVAGHLRMLVGADADQSASQTAPSRDRPSEALAAWRRFFLGLAARHPTILIIEDLHWADDALLDFLDSLVDPEANEHDSHAALMLVATARPQLLERRRGWRGLLTLAPLPDSEMAQLLTALLARYQLSGDQATSADLSADLLSRAGGNPLFAEEYVRMLRDRGVVPSLAGAPPTGVHTVIAARLDALRPAEKAILHDAAVLGRSGWPAALAAIGSHDQHELHAGLESLERKELIRRTDASATRHVHDAGFEFRHILVRDVAYDQIPRAQRAAKHRRAAEWLASQAATSSRHEPGERTADKTELIAHHYEHAFTFAKAAGNADEALQARTAHALRNAGDRATTLGVHVTAARYYTKALELWPEESVERPELELRAGRALLNGENGGDDLLVRARDSFLANGQPEKAAEAEVLVGRIAFTQGRGDRATHFDRARALVADLPPSYSKAVVLQGCMIDLTVAERNSEAMEVAKGVLDMARMLDLPDVEAAALGAIGVSKVNRGDASGVKDLERCVEIYEDGGSFNAIGWYINLAYAYAMLGNLDGCFETWSTAWQEAERFGLTRPLRWLSFEKVWEYYYLGNWTNAVRVADQLIPGAQAGTRHRLESPCRIVRGRISLARGNIDAALGDARSSLALAKESGDLELLDPALAFTARVLLAAGRGDEADELVMQLLSGMKGRLLQSLIGIDLAVSLVSLGYGSEALECGIRSSRWLDAVRAFVAGDPLRAADAYREIGSRPDEAYARLEAARRLLADGKPDQANTELDSALSFYQAVGAEVHIQAAESLRTSAANDR